MNVIWYGTATVGIEDGETRLLFDPFVRRNITLKSTPIEGFTGADAILITHGHFDHMYDIPRITQLDKKVPVYCTKTPAETLKKKKVPSDRINVIKPGDVLKFGKFTVTVYHGKHVDFDAAYIGSVAAKCTLLFPLFFKDLYINRTMPENDEIVIFDVENGGKHVMIMGSYGTDEMVEYPAEPDMFILAHGGSTKIPNLAVDFVGKLRPKKILVDHFDDAFPPLTRRVPVEKSKRIFNESHPDIDFIIPTECIPVEV